MGGRCPLPHRWLQPWLSPNDHGYLHIKQTFDNSRTIIGITFKIFIGVYSTVDIKEHSFEKSNLRVWTSVPRYFTHSFFYFLKLSNSYTDTLIFCIKIVFIFKQIKQLIQKTPYSNNKAMRFSTMIFHANACMSAISECAIQFKTLKANS